MKNTKTANILSNNTTLFPSLLGQLSWRLIVLFLVFLPFQHPISKRLKLPHQFLWMDEVFVVLAFTLFFLIMLFFGKISKRAIQLLFTLLLIAIIGMISGLYNSNPAIVTANGMFDYIKNFLVIPTFCLFSIPERKVRGLYEMLHRLALFFCLVAIVQEISFFIGLPVQKIGVPFVDVRFGLMRTPSLMGHPNIFGLYALLFFILDFALYRQIRWQNLVLATGVVLSISRMVWVAFFISWLFLLFQVKSKKVITVFVFVLVILLAALAVPYFYLHTAKEMGTENYLRGYALMKSMEIWKDHPILGVGPGMYGGVISLVFNSPIYEQYNFSPHWFNFMSRFRSLDQFWPQIMVEMGLIGTFAFLVLLYLLWKIPQKGSLSAKDFFRKRMLIGFSVVPIVLFIYLLGSGLNLTAFLLTYGILFGMVLGMKDENYS